MHKYLKNIGLSGAALTLAMAPALVSAQDAEAADMAPEATTEATTEATAPAEMTTAPVAEITPEQVAAMQAWPADQQEAFKAWPAETQGYFWSLTEERQATFWRFSDPDKVKLSQMTEPQQDSVWAQIEQAAAPSQG